MTGEGGREREREKDRKGAGEEADSLGDTEESAVTTVRCDD